MAEHATPRDGWLSPFELSDATARQPVPATRASNTGCLAMPFADYLALVDWTGRQLRQDKRGAIPEHLAPIFERLKVSEEGWLKLVVDFSQGNCGAIQDCKGLAACRNSLHPREMSSDYCRIEIAGFEHVLAWMAPQFPDSNSAFGSGASPRAPLV